MDPNWLPERKRKSAMPHDFAEQAVQLHGGMGMSDD